VYLRQPLEGYDVQRLAYGTASAKTTTLSFWVKSNVTGTYVVFLSNPMNNRGVSAAYTITASGTWERKKVTFPADTNASAVIPNDNGEDFAVCWGLVAGSNETTGTLMTAWASTVAATNGQTGQTNLAGAVSNYWQLAGAQWEEGAVASPFEFRSYEAELRTCQRYYWRCGPWPTAYAMYAQGRAQSTTVADVVVPLPTPMRALPTYVNFATQALHVIGVSAAAVTAIASPAGSVSHISLQVTVASGLTAGTFYWLGNNNDTTGYLAFSADLGV
jgi:hypothetical protein